MTVIPATECGGYLYHQGTTIRGVAFAPLPELAGCDFIIIPEAWAARFVRGELDHRAWWVWNRRLFQPAELDVLELPDGAADFVRLEPGGDRRIGLCLRIVRAEQRIVAYTTELVFQRYTTSTLPLLFVRAGDPSAVLFRLDLPIDELQRQRRFERIVPFDFNQQFDIYTQRLFPSYVVEYDDDETNLSRALPSGHFVDLMKFENGNGAGLHALVHGHTLRLRVGKDAETYDREGLDKLRLLFSERGDPALLLYGTAVPVAELDGAELTLPAALNWPFDIWSQLLFRNAYVECDAAHH